MRAPGVSVDVAIAPRIRSRTQIILEPVELFRPLSYFVRMRASQGSLRSQNIPSKSALRHSALAPHDNDHWIFHAGPAVRRDIRHADLEPFGRKVKVSADDLDVMLLGERPGPNGHHLGGKAASKAKA